MLTATSSYKKLQEHFAVQKKITLLDLFAEDKDRFERFHLSYDGLIFDFSKNNITEQTLAYLIELAHECQLGEKINAMFNGEIVNNTENRAALHTALRNYDHSLIVEGTDISFAIKNVMERMRKFCNDLHNGAHLGYTGKEITDIVNIGIGGSDLGPTLVCEALKPYRKKSLRVHFMSSVDGVQILDLLANLSADTTLFIVASKTFTTQETMANANTIRTWFLNQTNGNLEAIKLHFVAASTNKVAVAKFGIDVNNMFEFWDFVGGRYSLYSSIGLVIALYVGFDNFTQLLAGARAMDDHFRCTYDFRKNLPVVLALIGIWYINFYDYNTLVISPYNTQLRRFPSYVQQLEMESNGKAVDKNGNELTYKTCPVIWGDSGINGQHAYYQLLHQGTSIYPMDIILALENNYEQIQSHSLDMALIPSIKQHHDILVSNAYAQAEAFMRGKTYTQAENELLTSGMSLSESKFLAKHKVFKGNRPTNMLLLPHITPYYLGMLIALYEHKTFVQGAVWGINSFDQWGVELGKQLAKNILNDIQSAVPGKHDDSTVNLINLYLGR